MKSWKTTGMDVIPSELVKARLSTSAYHLHLLILAEMLVFCGAVSGIRGWQDQRTLQE